MPTVQPSKESVDLRLIELFVRIARSNTIAEAARKLDMSPSLATRRLSTLEKALQVRLFQRTTRAIHLTDAGRVALCWAEAVLAGYADLTENLSLQDQAPQGTIRLAVSDYVASVVLPGFLKGFMVRYPKVSYDIRTTDHLVNPVDHGFDVTIHSGFVPDSSLIGVQIRPVQRILCASPDYVRSAPPLQHPPDLERHTCLTHGAVEPLEWHFERCGRIVGQRISQRLCVDSFIALKEFALNGLGVIRISQNVVCRNLQSGDLVQVMPQYRCVQPKGDLPAMWVIYANRKLPYRIRTFVSELQAYLNASQG